jgi:hypothetical protein
MADDEQYTPTSDSSKKLRWQKFNFRDWRNDEQLRLCARDVQAVWLDLVGLIYEANDAGRLSTVDGDARRPYTRAELCRITGDDWRVMQRALDELFARGVYDKVGGYVVSRRLARAWQQALQDASNGAKGGNPSLKNKGVAEKGVNPRLKAKSIEVRDTVVSKEETTDAGASKTASPLQADREFVWSVGKGLLTEAGASTQEAGALLGALVKRRGLGEAKALILSMRANPPVDVRSYVAAIIHGRKPAQAVDDEPAHPIWTVDRDETTGKLVKRRRV